MDKGTSERNPPTVRVPIGRNGWGQFRLELTLSGAALGSAQCSVRVALTESVSESVSEWCSPDLTTILVGNHNSPSALDWSAANEARPLHPPAQA